MNSAMIPAGMDLAKGRSASTSAHLSVRARRESPAVKSPALSRRRRPAALSRRFASHELGKFLRRHFFGWAWRRCGRPPRHGVSDVREPCENIPVARLHCRPRRMMACLHNHLPADQHRPYGGSTDDEDPGIEPAITAPRPEIGMVGIEHHDVGAQTGRERADRPLQRAGAACCRVDEQPSPGRLALPDCHDVARALRQTLPVLQLSQLGRCVDLNVGVGADCRTGRRQPDIRRRRRCRRRGTLPSADRDRPRRPIRRASAPPASSCESHGSRTSVNRGRRFRSAIRSDAARAPRRTPPLPSPARRRGCGSARPAHRGTTIAQRFGRHGAQRVRRDPDRALPADFSQSRCVRSTSLRNRSGSLTKRRWPAAGGAPPKPPLT